MGRILSDKQLAHIERLKASGHFSKAGSKGGRANVRKYGSEGMAERGFKGAARLIEKQGGMEQARKYYSEIGSLPKGHRKETSDE